MRQFSMKFNLLYVVILLSSALLFSCAEEPSDKDDRPNIVLIMADDMGYSDIGCYGGEINTPNLDGLAKNGLRFTQFYNTSRCCPTRASLMTGLYPHQAGIGHMMADLGPEGYNGNLSRKAATIAEVLQPAGYQTYMAGKWHLTPGHGKEKLADKSNWPLQRGFQRFFGTIHGAGSFYDPNSLASGNTQIAPTENFYYTDAISDTAVKYIDEYRGESPLFMYVAYTAAHWPMHALPKDIAKYKGKYDMGWDEMRDKRYAKMIEMGLIKKEWPLSPSFDSTRLWNAADMKAWHAQCMEVYAAMVDNMDQGIGRIKEALQRNGKLENTLIFYLQDNGACAEEFGFRKKMPNDISDWPFQPMAPGELQYNMVPKVTRDGRPLRQGRGVVPGPADTYVGYDAMWANASNTPFCMFKHWSQEGGISSPLIVHWPKGISAKNELRQQPSHLIDIMATCLDVAHAPFPDSLHHEAIRPPEGESLVPVFDGKELDRKILYWEHEGKRAIREGKWKLVNNVQKGLPDLFWIDDLPMENWALYDLEIDRTETKDLADQYPEKVKAMADKWMIWAKRTLVVPKPVSKK